ncbi:MAG: bifunctional diaminohydroxyphosphoribosylaminopyrimidine deaminase/5-amino-6-(5-phosphoribosylamino)uracil reductase RibD [Dokdonella sp.]|uniref:bifunctional diaminohydroxyphosphoribosylaminopyrimidine deaminase/5-amino-6-(5-phosphoribosylamino)uracil reductase RibD n=1 Tax=Dokdonella sp. TaxID=2291710 RepID=UPI003F7E2EF3
MAHALRLAAHGLATTQPNPRVGCVIARGDTIVGEGWHRREREPHAEVLALEAAGAEARGATAYVTLEPCGLYGRTPPCADALIDAGVARVVVASEDASQRGGGALERLRAAGVAVETGLMRDAARELNRGFFARVERRRPWLRLKLAMSLDGRTALASGESKWITGDAARADVQRWRARSSALLTGSGTVLADDPRLTVRLDDAPVGAVAPLRVVLDSTLRTPRGAHVLDGSAPTLVLHAAGAHARDDRFAAVERVALDRDGDGLDRGAVLALLAARGMNEVQVEAGPTLCGALFAAGFVDEMLLYVAPVLLGDDARALLALPALARMCDRARLRVHEQRMVGDDMRLLLRPADA